MAPAPLEGGPAPLPMPLCIDGRIVPGAATGVAHYAANLRAALAGAGVTPCLLVDSPADRSLAPPRPGILSFLARMAKAARPGARVAAIDAPDRFSAVDIFREAQRHFDLYGRALPVELPGPPGIMHWTYPLPLRARGWRNVYTVHDLIPILTPALTSIDRGRYARLLRAIARRADRLVTVSATARDELIAWLGGPAGLVVDCGQGIGPAPAMAPALPAGLAPDAYFLAVGTIEPRKNLARLIAAHAASGARRPLVLAGPDGWRAAPIRAAIARAPGVIRLEYQPPATMARLMHDATALLFPSLAEGFGMPLIEAMAAGTAVLTADRGALAEVAAGAALLVDPEDGAAIAQGIARLERDEALRRALVAAGARNVARYTPARHAERLLALYRDIGPP